MDYDNQGGQVEIAAHTCSNNPYSPVANVWEGAIPVLLKEARSIWVTALGGAADAETRDLDRPEKSAKDRGSSPEFCPKLPPVVKVEGCLLAKWSKEWSPLESFLAHKLLRRRITTSNLPWFLHCEPGRHAVNSFVTSTNTMHKGYKMLERQTRWKDNEPLWIWKSSTQSLST